MGNVLGLDWGAPNSGPNPDLAKAILLNTNFKFNTLPSQGKDINKQGILGRVIDILSRPNYAVANAADYYNQGRNPFGGAFRGLSGTEKTTFQDVIKNAGYQPGWKSAVAGLAGDIFLDPTTYIGTGAVAKALKVFKGAEDIAKVAQGAEKVVETVDKSKLLSSKLLPVQDLLKANQTLSQANRFMPFDTIKPPVQKGTPLSEETLAKINELKISKSKAKINLTNPDVINPSQQWSAWKKLSADSKNSSEAISKLLAHENNLMQQGKQLSYWDGGKFKLSDAIAELRKSGQEAPSMEQINQLAGTMKLPKGRIGSPEVAKAFHNVRVRNALGDSVPVQEALAKAAEVRATLGKAPLSEPMIAKLAKRIPISTELSAKLAGASDKGAATAGELAKSLAPKGAEISDSAIKSELGLSHADFTSPMGNRGKVVDSIMSRMFSWYGQKDIRPITEKNLMAATNNAALRQNALLHLVKNYTPEEQLQALKFAQGIDSQVSPLGLEFKKVLENIFSGTGAKAPTWFEKGMTQKAQIPLDKINEHLSYTKAPWRFKMGAAKDPYTGQDLSYGKDWINSWKSWDAKDPVEFFSKVTSAVENAMHEKAIYTDLAARFGSKTKQTSTDVLMHGGYLDGVYLPQDIAKQVPHIEKDIKEFYTNGVNSPFIKQLDKIQRLWKISVTLPNPSHHIRNIIGDSYLAWMDGVNSITPYKKSMQILRSQRHRYNGINDIGNLADVGALDKAMAKTPAPGEAIVVNKSGLKFTPEQIYIAANRMGILPQANVIEDIVAITEKADAGLLSKTRHSLESFSTAREHFSRLAHFVDRLAKSNGKDYRTIFEDAGRRVRKYHPDYLTLTPFEKKYLRRIMPFYSWTRKAIPLVIEGAVMQPGKTLVYPKMQEALQSATGIDAPSRSNPFPNSQLFPQWIIDKGVGPIFDNPALGARGSSSGTGDTIVNPSNPTYDLISQFSDPLGGIGSMLTPGIRIPMELLQKRETLSGAPITSSNFPEYLGKQVPIFSTVQGISGYSPTLDPTRRAEKDQQLFNKEAFINWLTAAGIRGTGPYIKQAQIEKGTGGG